MSISSHLSILLVCSSLAACDKSSASPTKPAVVAAVAVPSTTFGAGVKLTDTTPIDAVINDPMAWKGKTVRVEGMVTDVCPKRGCWFEMAGSAPGTKLKFKVTDGEMVFPPDTKGRVIVAEGVVSATELSIEDSRRQAEEQAKEYGKPYDPASITKPTVSVRIDGTGAVFKQ